MPPVGNVNSFRATGVPSAKPPAAPARTNRSPLAAAIAARPAPTAPAFADRPHGSGTISAPKAAPPRPASAYRNPPAKAAAPSAPRQSLSPSERLARVIAGVTQDAANNPWATIDRASPLMAQPIRQMMMQAQYSQDFQNLQSSGLLPHGAQQPPLSFVDQGAGRDGNLSYEIGSGGHGHVYLTPFTVEAATDPQLASESWYGQEIPIHELAHALQRRSVQQNVVTREGGAQAFADSAVPAVVGPVPTHDTNYARYVRQVERKGPAWYMRQQFGAP